MREQDRRFEELDEIQEYSTGPDQEHDGRRCDPAVINRKIAAAKSGIRYAFRQSSAPDSLREKYQLEDVLESAKPEKFDALAVPKEGVLTIDGVRKLVQETEDTTIELMASFLVGTGTNQIEHAVIS
jgi:hypothetical protein